MLFNSYAFLLLFLPATLFAYHRLMRGQPQCQRWLLIGASALFYAWWSLPYLGLLLILMSVNYMTARHLQRHHAPRLLALGIAFNLGMLIYFKYTNFLLALLPIDHTPMLDIVLPLGISFFTFQKIAFLVDSYRQQCEPPRPDEFALFVLFFPQLIAGPIVHARQMLPQIRNHPGAVPAKMIAHGLFVLIMGLTLKVVLADTVAPFADKVFAAVTVVGVWEAWTGALAYTLQIYWDFAGYSTMAIGLAMMFGYQLPRNFNNPYRAHDIGDFWRRWHITLGAFLREYLYIPLGGSRHGLIRQCASLTLTMLLGGLWHGAGWQFIAWGALHAMFLCVHAIWRRLRYPLPAALANGLTLVAVIFAWVPFRARTLSDAKMLWAAMLGSQGLRLPDLFNGPGLYSGLRGWELWLVLLAFIPLLTPAQLYLNTRLDRFSPHYRSLALSLSMAVYILYLISMPSSFLYFQF